MVSNLRPLQYVIWIRFLDNCDDEVPEVMAAEVVATVLVKNGVKTPKNCIRVVGGGYQWFNKILGIVNRPEEVHAEVERVSGKGSGNCQARC